MEPSKERYRDPAQRRLYPLAALHSAMARPMSWTLWKMGVKPNPVSVLSLLVSLAGLALLWIPRWQPVAWGALLVYLGLILDHADGQVARRRGGGSTWGMYLDMAIDRVVEVGLMVALVRLFQHPAPSPPHFPAAWQPFSPEFAIVLAAATLGLMMAWRFLTAYNDILYLRSHLMATKRLPDPVPRQPAARRPFIAMQWNRDWVLLLWCIGVAIGQPQAVLLLFAVVHAEQCAEKMVVFWLRHKDPEADAARILGKDYH